MKQIVQSNWLFSERPICIARMASAADVRDIMGLPAQETAITKDSIINADKKKKEKKKDSGVFQRPEGMHRYNFAILECHINSFDTFFPGSFIICSTLRTRSCLAH